MSTTVQDINILALPASTPIKKRYNIRFPQRDQKDVPQDDEWCEIIEEDTVTLIRFHAYAKVFRYAGLYDQLFGGPGSETQCVSPQVIARLLESQLHHHIPANDDHDPKHKTSLRVLDVGAGNGMMGEAIRGLARGGGAKIVGCDILPEARVAAERGVYDVYLTADLAALDQTGAPGSGLLRDAGPFNILTVASAVGYGHIPPEALFRAASLIEDGGLVAFNLKDDFVEGETGSSSGFDGVIRDAVSSGALRVGCG